MRTVAAVATFAVTMVSACAPALNRAADEESLRRADSTYSVGMRTLDVPALTALLAPDVALYPPNEATITGLDGARQYYAAFTAAPGLSMAPRLETLVVSAAGDMGYTLNVVDIAVKDSLGNAATDRLRDIHFWRKDAGGVWRIVQDLWYSERPLAPAAKP